MAKNITIHSCTLYRHDVIRCIYFYADLRGTSLLAIKKDKKLYICHYDVMSAPGIKQ